MAIILTAPQNSFVQFSMSNETESCEFPGVELCLPVLEDNDVTFQFIITTDTEAEANALCDLTNSKVRIGIVETIGQPYTLEFSGKTERYRIGTRQILYNWGHGLPGFASVIDRGQCFYLRIIVDVNYNFYSTCFQRIAEACHTSVIEYSNDDNFAGFNYCNSVGEELSGEETCYQSTIVSFTQQETLTIPYTAALRDMYGNAPSIKVWIYNEDSELVASGVYAAFDAYPVNNLNFNFGGAASGIIVIK